MAKQSKEFFLFSFPAIAILLLIAIYPIVKAVILSLQNVDLRMPWTREFVGFANYIRLLSDHRFLNSLKVSLIYSTATLSLSILIGLALAFFVQEYFKGRLKNIILFLFLLPFVIPRVSVALMWKFMYSPLIGIYNYLLGRVGINPIPFLSSPKLALPSIVAVDTWQWCFFIATLIVASMELIPKEPVEAAKLAGAGRLQVIMYITFPFLKPSLMFIVFIKWVESLRAFDLIYNMTRGGPGIVTETLDLYAYTQGISIAGEISYASSIAIVMLIMTILIITVASKWIQK